MKKTKVLMVTGTMNAGGAETLIMEILRHKTPRMEYALLIHYVGKKPIGIFDKEIEALGVPMYYIPSIGSIGLKKYTQKLMEINNQYGTFDILHSHLNDIGGAIVKAAKAAGIPARVVHCHADIKFKGGTINKIKKEALLQVMRAYIDHYATNFWACSELAAKRLFYKKRLKEAVIIPNVINVESYLKTATAKQEAKKRFSLDDTFVIGAVGRVAPIKNYEFIIRLVKRLKESGTDVVFACFGRAADEAYYQSLLRLAKDLEVEEQVKFLGNSANVAQDIHCFDAFVMPSLSEGFGIAAIEAQAAGIATIVSTGVPSSVDMGVGLISFIDLEEELWVEALKGLYSAPPVARTNEEITAQFTAKGFNSKTAVQTIENYYIAMNEEAQK